MYFKYLFNKETGEIRRSSNPRETDEILSRPNWSVLSLSEYEKIAQAIKWAKSH